MLCSFFCALAYNSSSLSVSFLWRSLVSPLGTLFISLFMSLLSANRRHGHIKCKTNCKIKSCDAVFSREFSPRRSIADAFRPDDVTGKVYRKTAAFTWSVASDPFLSIYFEVVLLERFSAVNWTYAARLIRLICQLSPIGTIITDYLSALWSRHLSISLRLPPLDPLRFLLTPLENSLIPVWFGLIQL